MMQRVLQIFVRAAAGVLVAVLAAGGLVSCRGVHFYVQGARGQWELKRKARPVAEVLRDEGTPAKTRERLERVEELREFAAAELGLSPEGQYDHFADLGRPYVVWVVYAAPEFSTQAKTWWYPVLGRLKYRGWFTEAAARREGEALKAKGFDVQVAGTEAYSTLGWLRDPVLNTFLHRSDAELAELIFHELTHQAVFVNGDTDFNEALATAVGEAGASLWLKRKGRMDDLAAYNKKQRLKRLVIAEVLKTKKELGIQYAAGAYNPLEVRRAEKTAAFERLRNAAAALRGKAGVTLRKTPPLMNNASLNSVAAYYSLLPDFERLLAECGSVPTFLERVRAMKDMSREDRRRLLATPAGPDRAGPAASSPSRGGSGP